MRGGLKCHTRYQMDLGPILDTRQQRKPMQTKTNIIQFDEIGTVKHKKQYGVVIGFWNEGKKSTYLIWASQRC